jgi:hypothetical protein
MNEMRPVWGDERELDPSSRKWASTCVSLERAGFRAVQSRNPYWDTDGRTFEDADGYRVVLQNTGWPNRG